MHVCPRGVLESESQPARADNNNTTLGIPESNLPSLPGYSDSSTPLGQICTCGNLKIFVVGIIWGKWGMKWLEIERDVMGPFHPPFHTSYHPSQSIISDMMIYSFTFCPSVPSPKPHHTPCHVSFPEFV